MVIGVAGLLVGVAGLGIAVLMYKRPPKRTRLAYQQVVARYFDERDYALPDQAAMTYGDRQVKRLRKATVVLWNAGTEVLRGEDIVDADPVRLSVVDGRVLSHRVVKTPDAANGLRLAPSECGNGFEIQYNYLNPSDGIVVELMHDGTATAIVGKVKGLKDGPEDWGGVSPNPPGIQYLRFTFSVGLPTLAMLSILAFVALFLLRSPDDLTDVLWVMIAILPGFVALIWIEAASMWRLRRRHPKALRAWASP